MRAAKKERQERPAKQQTARAKAVTPDVKRRRVFYIAKLMVSKEWGDGSAMTKTLAKLWGLADMTVADMACEASRLLDFHVKDRDELIRLAQVRLREIGEEDGHDRVPAWRTLLENMGALRTKHELSGPDGAPIATSVTVEPIVHIRALLRDPPPELERLLCEEWGERTVVR